MSPEPESGNQPPAAGQPPVGDPPAGQAPPGDPSGEGEKKFTQADVDRILANRLGPLKEKAAAWDKQAEANKSDQQRSVEALAALQAKVTAYEQADVRRQAAQDAGLSPAGAALVTGDTPEAIAASITAIQALLKETTGGSGKLPVDPNQGRSNQQSPSTDWLAARLR